MHELWVKKTIYRRYLIEDENIQEAKDILNGDENGDEIVADYLDVNEGIEYDQEKVILPISFTTRAI